MRRAAPGAMPVKPRRGAAQIPENPDYAQLAARIEAASAR